MLYIPITNGKCEINVYYKYSNKNFPSSREQFSLCSDGEDIIIYGGITSNKSNLIWRFDAENLEFNQIPQYNLPLGNQRYGHSSVLYNKKVYIFGGKTWINNYCDLGDLEYFSLNDKTWVYPSAYTKNLLQVRRNHIAETFSSYMIVHGGINEYGDILNDTYIFNLNLTKWSDIMINENNPGPFLAYHASCIIIPKEIKNSPKLNVYKLPESNKKLNDYLADIKGLFIFGGKTKQNKVTNDVWILKFGKKPVEWISPTIYGKPPMERYLHTLDFYEERQFIIIHGGRNDTYDGEYYSLNDTFILDLAKMNWVEVRLTSLYNNFKILNRCGHKSFIHNDKLIIFGGYNEESYNGSHLMIINLNFSKHIDNEIENLRKTIKEFNLGPKNPRVERFNDLRLKTKRISIVEEFKFPKFGNNS